MHDETHFAHVTQWYTGVRMSDQTILCPKCATTIPLSQALTAQLESQFTKRFDEQLASEKRKLWAQAMQAAEKKEQSSRKELEEQLKEKAQKLELAEKAELELRKKSRQIEERERTLELELQRKLDAERLQLIAKAKQEEAAEQNKKLLEKDTQLESMKKTIEDLKRKSEQGSMQVQGETLEQTIKDLLKNSFPADEVSDVPTGITGADLVQQVQGRVGAKVGTILWESKNTKAFSEGWLTKLKQDQGKVGAEVAVLVTQVIQPELAPFGSKNGVWITDVQHAIPLASILRMQLIELSKLARSLEGQDEKMSQLYGYLTGPQFKNRVENMVIAFMSMQQDLAAEKRAYQKLWGKREKELEKLLSHTVGMYGDFQGIVGGSLPTIQQLELADDVLEQEQPSLLSNGEE